MITLGLTGGIGSGKSAAAARLAEKPGVRVVYADLVARQLMETDAGVRAAIAARFGQDVYRPDGALDRAVLAARVFGKKEEVAALNAIVHPAVRRAADEEIARARADGMALLVYEAALIYEVGADRLLDRIAAVYAPMGPRLARVMARDGVTRDAVVARMQHQLPPAELRRRADFVLENHRDLAHLHAQVDALHEQLVGAAASTEPPPSA